MKTDIDSLMQSRDLDALLIVGPGQHNPAMVYLTGGAHLTEAYLIKKRGEPPLLFHRSMERDEALRTGLKTKTLEKYRFDQILGQMGGDILKATVARTVRLLDEAGLTSGRVAVYGQSDAGAAFAIFSALQASLPDLTLVGELGNTLLGSAMTTKDQTEIEQIRHMGQITTTVVDRTANFITSHQVINQMLVKPDGNPLTIGDVKKQINLWLAELGAENPKGTIFAMGYDSAVPHSTGTPSDSLRLGQTIIFDLFPCEAGGGYFYDLTRTWCLGYAPDEALALYEDVLSVYSQIMNEISPGKPCRDYQDLACEIFQTQGHPTIKEDPLTEEGYVHSLGHGLGLQVHEHPFMRSESSEDVCLEPGMVVTVEPGLYYPQHNLGMRLEDTIWMLPDGSVEPLAEYPLDLVLPMR